MKDEGWKEGVGNEGTREVQGLEGGVGREVVAPVDSSRSGSANKNRGCSHAQPKQQATLDT
eukprot:scaffold69216_cov32-Tisochrysis_lutea.AAC.1